MATSKIINNSTAWAVVPSKARITTLDYKIQNGIVFVVGYDNAQFQRTANSWNTLGYLPEGARPSKNIFASGSTRNKNTYEIQINEAGQISINPTENSGFVSFSVSFPLGS